MKLSHLVGTSVVERPNGEIGVYVAGEPIVDGAYTYDLDVVERESDGQYDVVWKSGASYSKDTVITNQFSGGVLQSNIHMRDNVINQYIGELDELAKTLIYETNKLHVSGQGLERFNQLTGTNTVQNPMLRLNNAFGDLPFDVTKGTFQVKVYSDTDGDPTTPEELVGTYDVAVDPETDTIGGIAEKISNSDGNPDGGAIQAYVTPDGALKIMAPDGHTFAFGEDTSGVLVAAGLNNFFKGTDASTIEVEQHIVDNPNYISSSSDNVEGNNVVGLAIAGLKQKPVVDGISIDEFYGYFVGKIATDKQQVDIFVTTKTLTHNSYAEKLQSLRGVSMEEESAKLIQFQRILQANSRFVTAVDEMLNVIINGMGLVGR
jgi:flagellar hook-associated protein 1 FlgK